MSIIEGRASAFDRKSWKNASEVLSNNGNEWHVWKVMLFVTDVKKLVHEDDLKLLAPKLESNGLFVSKYPTFP